MAFGHKLSQARLDVAWSARGSIFCSLHYEWIVCIHHCGPTSLRSTVTVTVNDRRRPPRIPGDGHRRHGRDLHKAANIYIDVSQ